MTIQGPITARPEPGRPNQLGAHFDGEGTNFAVFSQHGEQVYLCLFSTDGRREVARLPLPERTGAVWHGYLPGIRPGTLYGYRVAGPYDPERGHRFNANKLLLDPYTRQFHGPFTDHGATFGFDHLSPHADLTFNPHDSAPYVPKCLVSDPALFPLDAKSLGRGWDNTLIYEAHVKGVTALNPDVPLDQRGTFDGMATPPMLDHLIRLGVSTIELLPIQAIKSEGALLARGLVNYWGYNTIGFFAPEPRYLGPSGIKGFRAMVERFHAAGIEVILDVVYNHSAEGDHMGPTLSFRGLDNMSYYRLHEGQPRLYVNDTGTGNTLDISHPFVLRLVMDSLRFWVQAMGVDGFRFDLATTVCRERHGFDRRGGFLDALRQDPVLADVKLIAEPWDVGPGGYQLGEFPSGFGEWNDRYRDTVRRFWRGDRQSAQDLGSALLGSADVFERRGRRSWSSINYAASHDGFTLTDTTQYGERQNQANGEGNRDGHRTNYSQNFGTEGPSTEPAVQALRARRVRNLLATVLMSQGTPMLLAGDEGGHSQQGNNNAYCQDNTTTWLDWATMDPDLIAFAAAVSRVRRAHPVLRQSNFLHGQIRASDGKPDVEWRAFDGGALNWQNPEMSSLCLCLRGSAEHALGQAETDTVLLAFNRQDTRQDLHLPDPGDRVWAREIDTAHMTQTTQILTQPIVRVAAHSMCAFCLTEQIPG
ncbi:MAG: glycogen debranching protein GlgX [Rhodobacteraceae bacterium]|nr:glycogen debranching protein GlgX [Paracoccaceae bacterium]